MTVKHPRVLGIFAHPDDAELTCFGTLAALSDVGADVRLLFLSKGEGSRSLTAAQRAREAEAAAEVIRATVDLDHFEDGAVPATRHTFATIERHIREIEPTIIFTHFDKSGADDHQDHQVVGRVVLNLALRYSSASLVLQVEPPSAGSGFTPNVFVDVTNFIDAKIKAVSCYQSEADKVFMAEQSVRLRGNWWARQADFAQFSLDAYYEPFTLVTARVNIAAASLLAASALRLSTASPS